MTLNAKIIVPGGAGLVGQNLVARLKSAGYTNLVVLDKHPANVAVLRQLHPDIIIECVDLSQPGAWQLHFTGAHTVVMLQAQIGGIDYQEFLRNNLDSTKHVLDAIKQHTVPHTVHISSSVVNSLADDFYVQTKRSQEDLVKNSSIICSILRPTLMFGWFGRKHLGWLSRFMKKVPIFPIPGNGQYMRQPLYVGDFCQIIIHCMERRITGTYNISGLERIMYIDVIRAIKHAIRARCVILPLPYKLFRFLLSLWARFDRNPPFTVQQLEALVTKDDFEVIDWPGIFDVTPTRFSQAIDETFNDPTYSAIVLEF